MKVCIPHRTTKDKALEQLKAHSSKLMARFGSEVSGLQQEWHENQMTFSFTARGFSITGMLMVADEQVDLEINLPMLARLMEGQIRDRVTESIQEIFKPEIEGKEQNT
jgi:hypothetical protein